MMAVCYRVVGKDILDAGILKRWSVWYSCVVFRISSVALVWYVDDEKEREVAKSSWVKAKREPVRSPRTVSGRGG
jgi:hypothetical protein